jgi:hypothetical protein
MENNLKDLTKYLDDTKVRSNDTAYWGGRSLRGGICAGARAFRLGHEPG